MRASPDQTVASDAKCNHKGALYRQRATRLGTPVWALFWAHSARFSLGLFRIWNEKERRRRFFDRRLAQEMPMFAPNEIGTGRQIVNGFVASELSVGVSPHTRSVVLSTIDERGSPTRRMRDSLSPIAAVR